jgi:hypothetical protein
MTPTDEPRAPRKHQRGTNVRQRQAQVSVRLTADEYAAVRKVADRDGQSPASVLRQAFLRQASG